MKDHLLAPGTVQVWLAPLSGRVDASSSAWEMLSSAERARADRLRTPNLKTRFVLSHAWLRAILSQYLQLPPAAIEIVETASGKPELSNIRANALRFNMSHSGDQAVYAFCPDRDVGVDVEHCRILSDQEAIAARFFTHSETEWIRKSVGDGDATAFFRIWTRKEAYVKGLGHGVSHGLSRFSVLSESGSEGRALVMESKLESAWTIVDLDMPDNYVGAVAAKGADWRVSMHSLDEVDGELD